MPFYPQKNGVAEKKELYFEGEGKIYDPFYRSYPTIFGWRHRLYQSCSQLHTSQICPSGDPRGSLKRTNGKPLLAISKSLGVMIGPTSPKKNASQWIYKINLAYLLATQKTLKGKYYLILTHKLIIRGSVGFDEHSRQLLGSSYDFSCFKLTSPANDHSLEAQCVKFFYHFLIGVNKKLAPFFKDS